MSITYAPTPTKDKKFISTPKAPNPDCASYTLKIAYKSINSTPEEQILAIIPLFKYAKIIAPIESKGNRVASVVMSFETTSKIEI